MNVFKYRSGEHDVVYWSNKLVDIYLNLSQKRFIPRDRALLVEFCNLLKLSVKKLFISFQEKLVYMCFTIIVGQSGTVQIVGVKHLYSPVHILPRFDNCWTYTVLNVATKYNSKCDPRSLQIRLSIATSFGYNKL